MAYIGAEYGTNVVHLGRHGAHMHESGSQMGPMYS